MIPDKTIPRTVSGCCPIRALTARIQRPGDPCPGEQALSIESAVHKCTGRAAKIIGLKTKGILAPGMDADLNIFDLSAVHTCATYSDPAQFSAGMDTVFVAGRPAILNDAFTGSMAGTVLTR